MKPYRILWLLILVLVPVVSGAEALQGTFWIRADLEAPTGETNQDKEDLSPEEMRALESLLEEARWVFSGMIYGINFDWVPQDSSRQVKEELSLIPLALIPRGDPQMKVLSTFKEMDFFYVTLAFELELSQAARLRGWKGSSYPWARGRGQAPLGGDCRRLALENAIKETLRAWLQKRYYNRPRRVTGRVILRDIPHTAIVGPFCQSKVFLSLDLDEIEEYRVD